VPSLLGLAPGGVYPATPVSGGAVRSYRTLSPLPAEALATAGGLLSVALSLGSPPPGVTRHRVPVEPGLSSPAAQTAKAAIRPSGMEKGNPGTDFPQAGGRVSGLIRWSTRPISAPEQLPKAPRRHAASDPDPAFRTAQGLTGPARSRLRFATIAFALSNCPTRAIRARRDPMMVSDAETRSQ